MKLRITMTRLAKLDLDELIVYVGEESPKAALGVASRILARIDLLKEQPDIGRRGRIPGTHELVVGGTRYIVAYRINEARREVQILRILHTSKMWPDKI